MMAHAANASLRLAVPVFAVAGLVLGRVYFISLRRVVLHLVARGACLRYILQTTARIGATALLLGFAARWGAAALLAAFAGFLAARQLTMRSVRGGA